MDIEKEWKKEKNQDISKEQKKEKIEIAKVMLKNGEDIEKIQKYTNLTKEEILNLNT